LKPTIVFLSTYPPRECGIATFTQDLLSYCEKFLGERVQCKVAALNLTPLDTYKYPKEVAWKIDQNSKKAYLQLAKKINDDDMVRGAIVQHEYGIFGGEEGYKVLHFMTHCKKPILVTLHTILPLPSVKMKRVTQEIIRYATVIVVLTRKSKELLEKIYPESIGKVSIIPHGIHPTIFSTQKKYKSKLELNKYTILSTFGLLSRGKGIEYVIKALPAVIKKHSTILYLILGETHPVIRRREGEEYRVELINLVKTLGLKKHVKFYDQYLTLPDLFSFLKATDIYISSSTNPNQAVSGTLSYALGSGRAVISTQFAQSKEIVTSDIGRLVPIQDSASFTGAILDLLSDKQKLKQMHMNAFEKTRSMLWSNVAKQYIDLFNRTIIPTLKTDHLQRMTDDFGIFQFASNTTPNKQYGYTLDDNARALIACLGFTKQEQTKEIVSLISIYFSYIQKCQLKDGSFINYISFDDKSPTEQNEKENLEDTQGRALWAVSEILTCEFLSAQMKDEAKKMFLLALKKCSKLTHLRAQAFAIKAFVFAQSVLPEQREELTGYIIKYADSLVHFYEKHSNESWSWFEQHLTYSNGLLAESLITASTIIKNPEYIQIGISALRFLIDKTFSEDGYCPIGNSHWYRNNLKRSLHDQQPEDPSSMILALMSAYKRTHDEEYKNLAKKCFSWFLGNNSLNTSLYNDVSGGCYDGIQPDKININQGAESLVSYLMARNVINSHKDS